MEKNEVRAALLKQLIKAIGNDRVGGICVESVSISPKSKEMDDEDEDEDEDEDKKLKDLGKKPFSALAKE